MSAIRVGLAICILAGGLVCAGQDGQRQASQVDTAKQTGSLSGIVYCSDTYKPARLAEVYLVQYSDETYSSQMFGKTDLDGRFVLNRVPEGDFFLATVLPGYADLLSRLMKAHLDAMSPEDRKKMLAQLPRVTISADQPAHVSIRLERSAEIDGRVLYDDGSPAPGLIVSYEPRIAGSTPEDEVGWTMFGIPNTFSGPSLTDDEGRFRILGVSSGEYLVRVTVPTLSNQQEDSMRYVSAIEGSLNPYNSLNVYVGGGFRASKSEMIKVEAGGATRDADITIPLNKLHTVRGQVKLKSTGMQAAFANVQLLYADTREQARSVFATSGKFEIDYVPEGSFVLRAVAAAKPPPNPDDFAGQSFHHVTWAYPRPGKGTPEMPLEVKGDLDNVTVTVPNPIATDEKGPLIDMMVGTQPAANSSDDQN